MIWQPTEHAPRDGQWILYRGRNSAGRMMVPMVIAWGPPGAPRNYGWFDSGTFRPVHLDPGSDFILIDEIINIASRPSPIDPIPGTLAHDIRKGEP